MNFQDKTPTLIPPHGGYRDLQSYQMTEIENSSSEIEANAVICVIHQTNYLLDRQLKVLEQEFIKDEASLKDFTVSDPRPVFGTKTNDILGNLK